MELLADRVDLLELLFVHDELVGHPVMAPNPRSHYQTPRDSYNLSADLSTGKLDAHAAGQSARNRRLIRIFELATDGDAAGDAADGHSEGLDEPRQVQGGRLPLHVRAGGHDDLLDARRSVGWREPGDQLRDAQVLRADPLERGQEAVKDVVAAAVLPGPLDGEQLRWCGDRTQEGGVAT